MSAGRPRRVLLGCDFFLRYTASLAGGLDRAGADVALLGRDHDLEFGGRPGAAADFVAAAAGEGVRRCVVSGRVRSPRGALSALRATWAVRRFGADFVHLQAGIGNDPRLVLASGARPRRFALTVHDPVRHPGEAVSRSARLGNRALIRAAGLIFVHGEALREELREATGARAPIVVVPHGVDRGTPPPLPERPTVLFFGRIGPYKGLDVLLDAMPLVWERLPAAELTIAGEGELPDHPGLADDRVTVRLEHVPDDVVPGLFAAARCVALPYRQASQSGVGSLAKRYGRPLVATSVGALPELVGDGSGVVVRSEDPGALAEALVSVLGEPGVAERLAAAADRGTAWEDVAAATLRAYEEHLPAPTERGGR